MLLEKTVLPFPAANNCQYLHGLLAMGQYAQLLSPFCCLVLLVHAFEIPMNSYLQLPCCVQKKCSLILLLSFCLLFRSEVCTFPLGMRISSAVFYFLHLDKLWVTVLVSIHCKQRVLRGRLRYTLIHKYNDRSLSVSLIVSFSPSVVIDIPYSLGPSSYRFLA